MYMRRLLYVLLILPLLAACAGLAQPTPLPTLVLPGTGANDSPAQPASGAGSVVASGEVVPAEQIEVGFAAAGVVAEVNVKEGDVVKPGQILASQENISLLQLAVKASQQNLEVARKDLANLSASATLNLANAQLDLVNAQKAYDEAMKHRKVKDFHRCTQDTIDLYGQILSDAQDRLKEIQENSEGSSVTYLRKLTAAQSEVDVANANYLYCIRFTDQEVAESDAEIAVADAALKKAAERVDTLNSGAGVDPDQTARLQAAVSSAETALANAQSALERATLKAGFAGTAISVDVRPGQSVMPGQVLITLCSLDNLRVETTDLSEQDIARVKVGQSASVEVEALGKTVGGKVLRIAPKASKVGGDVVFKVIIALDEQPVGLLWGMSTKVQIDAD
jgi:HlyD family secretion protein